MKVKLRSYEVRFFGAISCSKWNGIGRNMQPYVKKQVH